MGGYVERKGLAMRLISNAMFLAQIKGMSAGMRYLVRVADADLLVLRVFGAIGVGCIVCDLIRIFNGG